MSHRSWLFFVLLLAACKPLAAASPSPIATSVPTANPTNAAQSPAAATCIVLAQSRFIDDPSPMVLQTEGITAAECAAIVERDNNQDEWARAHPEVVLDAAPTEAPMCSEVVDGARQTVWGSGLLARNYCFTIEYLASQSQRP
ncbi:MAG TPA: hypothetical protein VJA85_02060 [Candidatus Limnocylindria bacterium]|nr:hypothetical protein [Candidatus Limnocylindria bacterium]